MEIFAVRPVLDNPFFNGLVMDGAQRLESWPPDWPEKYQTWEVARLQRQWKFPVVAGDVEAYNDYPCVNLLFPAFSRRAVARLGETLTGNGELLLLNHTAGAFYFFNCTRLENCLDLEKTPLEKSGKGFYSKLEALFFDPDRIRDLTVFKVRTQPSRLFCTTRFVEQVTSAGLQGFSFLKVWPIPKGSSFTRERRASAKRTKRLRPQGFSR